MAKKKAKKTSRKPKAKAKQKQKVEDVNQAAFRTLNQVTKSE